MALQACNHYQPTLRLLSRIADSACPDRRVQA